MRRLGRTWWREINSRPPRALALLGALVSVWIALSPSLLPREWWMHAINVYAGLVFGYLAGHLLDVTLRRGARLIGLEVRLSPRTQPWLRRIYWAALAVTTIAVWWTNLHEQDVVARLVGEHAQALTHATAGLVLGGALGALTWALSRLALVAVRSVQAFGGRALHLPRRVAAVVAWVLVVSLAVIIPNNLLITGALDSAVGHMAELNVQTLPGRVAPTVPEKSGSPASLETWADLGAQGQGIVADGPHAADITAWSGRPAKEPIRAYAGLPTGRTLEEAADRVVAELDRTRAWERRNLVVMTSTGTGWIEEFEISPFEFLSDGDCAFASMQYSYLGSPLAFLLDSEAPRQAGTILFDKIYARWSALPTDARPKLYVSGYSLGSEGGQAAFATPEDMIDKVDGALWIGTPQSTPLWRGLTDQRQFGTPEIAPVVDNGRHIRFATSPSDLAQTYVGGQFAAWESPRIVYAQHASDPIVWWDWSLMWSEPDWTRERLGRDANPHLSWHPWATFWQLSGDMAISGNTVQPHGHRYQEELVAEWAAVLGGDPTADYSSLERVLRDRWLPR